MSQKVTGIVCSLASQVIEIPFSDKIGLEEGDKVIFKDADGKEEFGIVDFVCRSTDDRERVLAHSKILRKATANDSQKIESHAENEKEALNACRKLVEKHELDMQVFACGYSFDGERIHFIFTSEDRVDFRELVKDLAMALKKQIYLRQIGPRDKAKIVRGCGKCGRPLCCSTFLGRLESVNMEMVRVQGLEGKGSSKLSGVCGKLLCCLKYEMEAYRDLRKGLPNIEDRVKLKKSSEYTAVEGKVIGLDILNQKVKIFAEGGEMIVVDKKNIL